MGIYIKGMEMPTDGTYNIVYIYSDGRVSMPFWGKGMQIVQDINAIPVPPHGRLIDADAVERNLVKMQMAQKDVVAHGIRKSRAVVRDMATVIPADKDGET